jgi:hypothetical protein
MTRTGRATIAAAALLGLASAPAAQAAVVTLTYEEPIPGVVDSAYSLVVRAGAGELNRIGVASSPDAYFVADSGARLSPGSGCTSVTTSRVRCATARAARDRSVFVDAGDGDDRVGMGALATGTATEVRGGQGNDVIYGSGQHDLLYGGRGADGLLGGEGFDELDGGAGDDVLHGGSGTDTASYESRRRPVSVDLARSTGGGRGESDSLREIEQVVGGRGADDLRGGSGADSLLGGAGEARDRADGRAGGDVVIAYRAIGGPGNDSVDGRVPSCGSGLDTIYRGSHHAPGPFARGCEQVAGVFLVLRAQAVSTSRRAVVVALRCKSTERCRGTLELRDRRGVVGRRRFRIRAGGDAAAMHRVRIPLSRRPARRAATLRIEGVRAYQRSSFRLRVR